MRSVLVLALTAGAVDAKPIILPPVHDGALPERLLLFIPGGLVPSGEYTAMLQALQLATTGVRLTVAIPELPQGLCIAECLAPDAVACKPLQDRLGSLATAAGFGQNPSKDTFVAGHSMGATCANYLVQSQAFEYAGLLAMGGFIDLAGSGSLASFPIPVMHLSGELDGSAAKPSQVSKYFKQMTEFAGSHSQADALRLKPVQVIEGLDHADFCSGCSMDHIQDCASELAQDEALQRIAEGASAFLQLNSGATSALQSAALQTLSSLLDFSQDVCEPHIKASQMEASGSSGPWCTEAQEIISGLAAEDVGKLVPEGGDCQLVEGSLSDFEHWHTSYNLTDGELHVSCGSFKELSGDAASTGGQTSTKSVDCKMLDGTRVAQQLQVTTDLSVQCSDVNKQAVALAEEMLPEKTRKRYQSKGRTVCFKDDSHVLGNIGPLWLKSELKLQESAECLEVTSSALESTVKSLIFPGSHYCKLLSPAAAMDWMYTDSHKPAQGSAAQTSVSTLSKLVAGACLEVTMDSAVAAAAGFSAGTCAKQGFSDLKSERVTSTAEIGDVQARVYGAVSVVV